MLHETALSQFRLHGNSKRDEDRIGTAIPAGRRQSHISLAAGRLHHAVYICRLQEGQVASDVEGRLALLKSQLESLFQGVIQVFAQFFQAFGAQNLGHLADTVIAADHPDCIDRCSLDGQHHAAQHTQSQVGPFISRQRLGQPRLPLRKGFHGNDRDYILWVGDHLVLFQVNRQEPESFWPAQFYPLPSS